MPPPPPESPAARAAGRNPRHRARAVLRRTLLGAYADGFIHAGNLAYLALVSLFPFFIVTAALAHFLGRGPDTVHAVNEFLRTLPRAVRDLLHPAINDVLAQRTGSLLWLGGLLGLWTTGSFIETIRDILRRAYGVPFSRPFWHYRLRSAALIISAVMLTLVAFSLQLALVGAEQFVARLVPQAARVTGWIGWSRLAPALSLFVSLYLLFYALTPSRYRLSPAPKWPGAAVTAGWWVATSAALPWALAQLGGYDRTYGSLAGVIVALLFFWLVGFGLVIGAQLNAALADPPPHPLRAAPGSEEARCQD